MACPRRGRPSRRRGGDARMAAGGAGAAGAAPDGPWRRGTSHRAPRRGRHAAADPARYLACRAGWPRLHGDGAARAHHVDPERFDDGRAAEAARLPCDAVSGRHGRLRRAHAHDDAGHARFEPRRGGS
ncbi:MAG: hypothetical protein C0503_09640 [Gemmatimonas sp.]|nr:hypothetical protein [Gemmatimonas sp.]